MPNSPRRSNSNIFPLLKLLSDENVRNYTNTWPEGFSCLSLVLGELTTGVSERQTGG